MRVCGIDPGLRSTGWGIVDDTDGHLVWVADGMIRPDPDQEDARRLAVIHEGIVDMLSHYHPDLVGIEEVFVAHNAATSIKLGMARGAAMVAVAAAGLPLRQISAKRIKQNITGSGRADKNQISAMVKRLLNATPCGADAADALAIAISASHDLWNDGNGDNNGLASAIARALEKQDGAS